MIRRLDAQEDLTQALASERLGVASVLFFVMSAAAPLTVVAGLLTTAYMVTQNPNLPSAFIVIGAVLALFSVGYVTMGRHLPHAGAFYAYVSNGLGRPVGVGAAWVSLLTYNLLQVSLYGGVVLGAVPLAKEFLGVDVPWWVFALLLWALVATMGVFRVDLNGKVLAVLLVVEVVVLTVYDISFLAHPAHGLDFSTLSPLAMFKPSAGTVMAIAVLGFVGFESAVVFSEESRNPRRTVPLATYLSLLLIGGLYGLSAWAMAVSVGTDRITQRAGEDGFLFTLAGSQLGSPMATLGRVLFLTSLIAAMIAVHNTTARYIFALGRERVMPAIFGLTSTSGAPRAGSLAQSAVGLVVIAVFAIGGYDPLVQLFYTGGTAGALGILLLLMLSAIAVVVFFAVDLRGESSWHALIAPALSILGIGTVLYLVLANYAGMLNVAETSPLRWGIPAAFVLVGGAGTFYGRSLKERRPDVYATIGLGAKSAVAGAGGGAAVPRPRSGRRVAAPASTRGRASWYSRS